MSRGSVGIVSQIGVETTPGVAVAANRLLPSLSLMPKPTFKTQKYRAQGARTTTVVTQAEHMGEGELTGVLDYNSIIWLFNGIFPFAAGTQIGALQAYTRQWNAGVFTSDMARKTFTIEKGDAESADRYASAQIKSIGLEATQDQFNVKGSMFALYPELDIVLTAAPTKIPERPVQRDHINLYIDSTYAAIGTTQVTQARRESLDIGEKFKPAWYHNRSIPSFTDIVETPYEASLTWATGHNAQSRAVHAGIKQNPKKYLRWEAIGNLLGTNGATPVYEKIWLDMAVRFEKATELENDDDIYGYEYQCALNDDAAEGTHLIVTVVNGLANM